MALDRETPLMADQLDTDRSGSPKLLAPPTGAGVREDSGLQDILSVANKLKERDDLGPVEGEPDSAGDSGMIVFGSNDLNSATESDDSGLFVSFSGGLGAGEISGAPLGGDPDLAMLGGEGAVHESKPMEPSVRPAEEPRRNPLVALAVVLGLCLAGAAAVVLNQDDDKPAGQAQLEPEMSAKPEPATVAGVAAEPEPAAPTSAGVGGAAEADPLDAVEETAGAVGDTVGGPLQLADGSLMDAGDPLAQPGNLLVEGGQPKKATTTTAVKKPAGTSTGGAVVEDEPEPEPDPVVAPDPLPEPKKTSGGTNAASQDEVDCLLNPDLAKCGQGGTSGGSSGPVLVPKVPDKLDSSALKTGFNTVKTKAKACGAKFGAVAGSKVKIHASIEGATGKVTSVEATGEHAGTELGKCVEEAVKNATFEVFKSPAQGVDYSMMM